MSVSDMQDSLINTIETVVSNKIENTPTPQSITGVVVTDPIESQCIVNVRGTEYKCTLPKHLCDWVSKDDIVIIHDLYGNGFELVVMGISGSTRQQTLVISDETKDKGKLISGVTKFEDDKGELFDHELVVR